VKQNFHEVNLIKTLDKTYPSGRCGFPADGL